MKTYKGRCDVFMSWQWAHQSDCRVLHPLKIAKVRSGNTIQWAIAIIYSGFRYCLNNRLFLSIKKSFYPPNIMQMVKSRLTSFVDGGFHTQMVVEPRPKVWTLHTADTFTWSILSSDMLILSNCAQVPITINSVLSSFSLSLSAVIQVLMCRMQSCNAVTTSNSLALEPGLNETYNWLSSAYAVYVCWLSSAYTSERWRFTTSNSLLA